MKGLSLIFDCEQLLQYCLYFTAKVFEDTFHSLSHIKPDVLYPIPDFSAFQKEAPEPDATLMPEGQQTIFLSINRYERKKNLNLAIQAFGMSAYYKLSLICEAMSQNGMHAKEKIY